METFEFFTTLPKQLQKSILHRAKVITLHEGELLYEQGDIFAHLVLVKQGKLSVYRHHESGHTLNLYSLDDREGYNVDLGSSTIHTPCIGSAKAESMCEVYMVSLKELQRLLSGNIAFQEYLFELFSQKNARLAQAMEDLRFKTLDQRVFEWLKERTASSLAITHEEIAVYHGTRREVISRLLKKFELRGEIRLSRNKIEMIA